MISAIKHISRAITICRVLARNDALFLFEEWEVAPNFVKFLKLTSGKKRKGDKGKRLAKALQELGPAFIKLGQAMSTRSDILGDQLAADLAMLRDKLPPFDGEVAKKIVEEELEKPIDQIYRSFDLKPVAAASIAQVHFAEDIKGNKCAVKVVRPGIEKKFDKDVAMMIWAARHLEKGLPKMKRLKLQEVVKVFSDAVRIEMDLRLEAAAASELGENLKNDKDVFLPAVDWKRTSKRVLTMERIQGVAVDDVKALKKAKHDPADIITKTALLLFNMAFRDGFFHADMHPGNLFIDKKGRIGLVDFGIMGRLDEKWRFFNAEMLHYFLKKDFKRVAELHFEYDLVPDHQSVEGFTQACRAIAEPILDLPQNEISIAKLLAQLFQVAEDYEMNLQPQFLMLQKAIMLTEGIARKIYPDVNMWSLIEPQIKEWASDNLGPEARLKNVLDNLKGLNQAIGHFAQNAEYIFTPEGIRLHPETLRALQQEETQKNGIFKIVLVASVVSLVLYALLP